MDSGKGVIRLEWDTFQANIAEQYQSLRGAHDFTDVTLVCKDLSKTEAHRIILAAGSTFFNGLLGGGDQVKGHPHPMIFLPGVTRATLAPLLDFFYSGEASVAQEDLQDFLILSKSLGVKGLIQTEENADGTEDDGLNMSGDQKEYKTPASKNKARNLLRFGAEEGQRLKEETLEQTDLGEEATEDDFFVTLNRVSTCKVAWPTVTPPQRRWHLQDGKNLQLCHMLTILADFTNMQPAMCPDDSLQIIFLIGASLWEKFGEIPQDST